MKVFLLTLLSSCLLITQAQKQTEQWQFGNGVGLQFNGNASPTVVTGAISTSLGCASIANANGSLLFYTDGVTVYNQSHSVMPNGTGLSGLNSDQSLILKQPNSSNLYYIFTVNSGTILPGLRYSIVDMSLVSGTGSVTAKNIAVYSGTVSAKITAAKHCNGADYWVLVAAGSTVLAYSLTATAIGNLPVSSTLSSIYAGASRGCMKISPNNRKLGIGSMDYNPQQLGGYNQSVGLADFDNLTGAVSNAYSYFVGTNSCLSWGCQVYGVEFSADGSKFYYWATQIGLTQVDLCNGNNGVYAGFIVVNENSNYAGTLPHRSIQLATDKKIYVINSIFTNTSNTTSNTNTLGVINSPNLSHSLCNYNPFAIPLTNYTVGWGLPNFPGFYFEEKPNPFFTYTANPLSCNSVSFSPAVVCSGTGYSITGYHWNFGDPQSNSQNTTTTANPVHQYPSNGTYSVQLIRYFGGCTFMADTIKQLINITTPSLSVNQTAFPCGINNATVTASNGIGPYSYLWQPGNYTTAVLSFTSAGLYTVSMNDQGGGCAKQTTIQINNVILSASVTSQGPLCFGNTNGSATVNVVGGSGTYSYTWSASQQNSFNCTGLTAGPASVFVFDALSQCSTSVNFTITQPPAIGILPSVNSLTACPGQSIYLIANAIGGTAPYTYLWSGTTTSMPVTITHTPGIYSHSVGLMDANSCQAQPVVLTLTFYPSPNLFTSSTAVCAGNTATLTANGASNYTWQPGGIVGNQLTFTPIVNQVYTVTAEDYGCLITKTVPVTVFANPVFSLAVNQPVCEGAVLNFSSTVGFNYHWSGPLGFVSTLQAPTFANVNLLNAGIYTVMVTDSNLCSSSNTIQVQVHPSPTLSILGNNKICPGQTLNLSVQGALNYLWSTGSVQNQIVISPFTSTVVTVSGTNSLGCSSSTTIQVQINNSPTLSILGNNIICQGQTLSLSVQGALNYLWSTGSVQNQISIAPLTNTAVTVTGTNNFGCSSSSTVNLQVTDCVGLYDQKQNLQIKVYPNPNSGAFTVEIPEMSELIIMNYLGQLIFKETIFPPFAKIALPQISSGTYMLVLKTQNQNTFLKLLID